MRELRRAKDWTLGNRRPTRRGLHARTLSKIENGQMSPTYEALKKLAQGLGISVPQLFPPPSQDQVNGRMAVTRSGEGQAHATTTYEHELLAGAPGRARGCCMLLRWAAPTRPHPPRRQFSEEFDGLGCAMTGEEFLYVLTGVVHLLTEFLRAGRAEARRQRLLRRGDGA